MVKMNFGIIAAVIVGIILLLIVWLYEDGKLSFGNTPPLPIENKPGTMVPLYTYPTDPSWSEVVSAKQSNPSVPIVAIINPGNGPGTRVDPNYQSGIAKLHAAGCKVLGYVFTCYGTRPASGASDCQGNHVLTGWQDDIDTYRRFYNLDGMFFDQMSNNPEYAQYYQEIANYCNSLNMPFTAGNPGDPIPSSMIGDFDVFNVYEHAGYPSVATIAEDTSGQPPGKFSILIYDVPSLDTTFISQISQYVNYIYITDANLPNPWGKLSSYFSELVATLAK